MPGREIREELLEYDQAPDPHWTASIFAVWNLIIRPPRCRYNRLALMQDFPTERFRLIDQVCKRRHFHINNSRGVPLAVSYFEPIFPEGSRSQSERACIVYCHGNGACRLAGFRLAKIFLPLGISFCCFDFAGSGMSGGEFVSLGYYERDDLAAVIEHLRNECGISRIGLWGYSMGAATVLMHSPRDPSIAGLVADSPFSDLWELIKQVCFNFVRIPSVVILPVLHIVRMMIQQKANFDICDVSPQAHVESCFVPALFLHGEADNFITPSHTEKMREKYCGEAQRITMPGLRHATTRNEQYQARAAVHLVRALRWESFLPKGTGEKAFESLLKGRVYGGAERRDEIAPIPAEIASRIIRLLASKDSRTFCTGIIQAAMALCGPYRGAEFLMCGYPGGRGESDSRSAGCPVRFVGKVKLPNNGVEVGLCWVRKSQATAQCAEIDSAVFSTTVASMTSVSLRKSGRAGEGRTVLGEVFGSVGLECANIQPQDMTSLTLQANKSYDIALTITENYANLEIDGHRVARMEVEADDYPPDDELYLWVVQWKGEQNGWGNWGGESQPVKIELEEGPFEDSVSSSEPALEERMAQTLATLCLGEPEIHPKGKARMRSGVWVEGGDYEEDVDGFVF